MPFVKLDCGILDSSLWVDREARELFVTALLMAEPFELVEGREQLGVRDMKPTGFVVPPGWYGFIAAAGLGIIHRARMDVEVGMSALERLGAPEPESRSKAYEGRRLVRVDGGYIALNYDHYRQRDYTSAERQRRYRERKAKKRRAGKSAAQVRAEYDGREKRFIEAEGRGDEGGADRVVGEGL